VVVALTGCGSAHRLVPGPVVFAGVEGFLVDPGGTSRRPGVVLVHGSGGDRRELLPQALALARAGIVALTLTEPSSAHPPPPATTLEELLRRTASTQAADVAAIRAAASFLASRPDVDAARLGYLGWSSGAKLGAFVTGRFRALALLSAGAQPVAAFVAAAPSGARAEVRSALTPLDPIRAIAHARPGQLLLEDGLRDEVVPRAALRNVVRAAPHGTDVRWYAAGHALNARAYADARAWLRARLTA